VIARPLRGVILRGRSGDRNIQTVASFVDVLRYFVTTTHFMPGSPGLRAGSSSPARFNEDDTIAGIFIGPRCDLEKEAANLRRLQHALRDPEHESCVPSVDQSSTPGDIPDQLYSESEDTDTPSSSST
jgi:hypothetical protein